MGAQTVSGLLEENLLIIMSLATVLISLYQAVHTRKQTKGTLNRTKQSVKELEGYQPKHGETDVIVENVRLIEEYSIMEKIVRLFLVRLNGRTELDIFWHGRNYSEHFWESNIVENHVIAEEPGISIGQVTRTGGKLKTRMKVDSLDANFIANKIDNIVEAVESIANEIPSTQTRGFHYDSNEANWQEAIDQIEDSRE
jgi:hypothetical protein